MKELVTVLVEPEFAGDDIALRRRVDDLMSPFAVWAQMDNPFGFWDWYAMPGEPGYNASDSFTVGDLTHSILAAGFGWITRREPWTDAPVDPRFEAKFEAILRYCVDGLDAKPVVVTAHS